MSESTINVIARFSANSAASRLAGEKNTRGAETTKRVPSEPTVAQAVSLRENTYPQSLSWACPSKDIEVRDFEADSHQANHERGQADQNRTQVLP